MLPPLPSFARGRFFLPLPVSSLLEQHSFGMRETVRTDSVEKPSLLFGGSSVPVDWVLALCDLTAMH